jgi:HAD superfamily hydrolase (TIGR01662 family)
MTIKAVVFDFDDCLIRNFEFSSQELIDAAKAWNGQREPKLVIPDINVFADHYYGSWDEWILRMWPALEGHVDEFKAVCKTVPHRPRPAIPGAFRTLSILQRKGFVIGILTNRESETMRQFLEESGLSAFSFDFIHSTADHGLRKPNPSAFGPVIADMEKRGIKLEETLYVGDQLDDVSCKNAGLKFVAVCSGVVSRNMFLENGRNPNNIISSVSELPKYLRLE